ncbi:unnamed protein product [Calypogeia fissa]
MTRSVKECEDLRKGAWTAEEDEKLRKYIEAHGTGHWRSVGRKAGLQRCGKSCRLRWTNYLRPDIKHGNFSPEEEKLIVELHASFGSRWSLIAARLQGRTDNDIKNHWNTRLKKKLCDMGIDPVTHKPISEILLDLAGNQQAARRCFSDSLLSKAVRQCAKPYPTEPQEHSEGGKYGKEYHSKGMEDMSLEEMYADNASFSDMSGGFTDPEIVNPEIVSPHVATLDSSNGDQHHNTGASPKGLGGRKVSAHEVSQNQALQGNPNSMMHHGKFLVRLLSSSNSANKMPGPTLPMLGDHHSAGRAGAQHNSESFQGRDFGGEYMALQQHSSSRQGDFFGAHHNRNGVRVETGNSSCMSSQELSRAMSHQSQGLQLGLQSVGHPCTANFSLGIGQSAAAAAGKSEDLYSAAGHAAHNVASPSPRLFDRFFAAQMAMEQGSAMPRPLNGGLFGNLSIKTPEQLWQLSDQTAGIRNNNNNNGTHENMDVSAPTRVAPLWDF